MSFKKIEFNYIPPPTVQATAVLSTVPVVVSESSVSQFGSRAADNSNAADISTRLSRLNSTASYLQDVLKSLTPNLGVNFNLNNNPELGRALSRIYNTSTPPESMDLDMYLELLHTDLDFTRFDLLNGNDSTIQANPIQRTDVQLATKAFEDSLLSTGNYKQTTPILFRSLQGDQLIFEQLGQSIQTFPILSKPQISTLESTANNSTSTVTDSMDLSSDSHAMLSPVLDKWGQSYAATYKMLVTPDPVETALPGVVGSLNGLNISNILQIKVLLESLVSLVHIASLKQVYNSSDNIILPRMLSDVGSHAFNMDFMKQIGSGIKNTVTGGFSTILSKLESINIGQVIGLGLTPVVSVAAGGYLKNIPTNEQVALLSNVSAGIKLFAANVKWSNNEMARQSDFTSQSIQRLGIRKVKNQGDQVELLNSMKSINSSVNILQSIVDTSNTQVTSADSVIHPDTSFHAGLQSFNTLVGSVKSPSNSSYSVDGDTLVINPPSIPTASAEVQSVLADGGINQISTADLRVPIDLEV